MSYFEARSDKKFISDFIEDANKFMTIEAEVEAKLFLVGHELVDERQKMVQEEASQHPEYQRLRDVISKKNLRTIIIARKHNVPVDLLSLPPPMVGGAVIPVNVISSLLIDNSYQGVERQVIWDILIQTEGACEDRLEKEFRKLLNPFHWLMEILTFIVRIPFLIIQTSGFNVSKVEDHFLGKSFKMLELAIILYVAIQIGLDKEQLLSIISK
jgi:hypothetical protein